LIAADKHFVWNTLTRSVRLALMMQVMPKIDWQRTIAAAADAAQSQHGR